MTEEEDKNEFLTHIEKTDLFAYKNTRKLERVRKKGEAMNVLGISTTMMGPPDAKPRYLRPSTSEYALERVLKYAKNHGTVNAGVLPACNTVMLKLRDLEFDFCAGYYSANKQGCQWPCVITETEYLKEKKDNSYKTKDHMDIIYKALLWADVVFIATPIRYGNAGALYYKMIERLNSVHNEMTLRGHQVMREKVGGFIITGGQDGVQAVAGQMLTFWSELGFIFSRYSYVGWNRGWYAEDTRKNYDALRTNDEFEKDLQKLVDFAIDLKMRLDECPTNLLDDYENKEEGLPVIEDYKRYDPESRVSEEELTAEAASKEQTRKVRLRGTAGGTG